MIEGEGESQGRDCHRREGKDCYAATATEVFPSVIWSKETYRGMSDREIGAKMMVRKEKAVPFRSCGRKMEKISVSVEWPIHMARCTYMSYVSA
jgi:hypothetical protein